MLASSLAAALVTGGPGAWDWHPTPGGSEALGLVALVAGWVVLFFFSGLYAERYAGGRLDELVTLVKVVTFGVLVLLFGYALDRLDPGAVRQAMGAYARRA